VSAKLKDGRTNWVRVKSLAGEPCRVQPNMDGQVKLLVNGMPVELPSAVGGLYELPLGKGDEAVLYTGQNIPDLTVTPLPVAPEDANPFGGVRKLKPSLSTGKAAKASSSFGKTYAPSKAFDNDPATRWAGKAGTRNGWLEVDLGEERGVSHVVIHELQFASTKEFTVECEVGGKWKQVARGTTIAGVKKFTFTPVKTRRVRLNLIKTEDDVPTIGEFQIF